MKEIFLGLVALLVIYEVAALANGAAGDTISEIVWGVASKRPILPFAFGVLMGHFFWQKAS